MKGLYIFDTESNGLAGKSIAPEDKMDKFHCMLFKEYKLDNWVLFLDKSHSEFEVAESFVETKNVNCTIYDISELDNWLANNPKAIACQNQYGFDLKAFAETLGFTYSMHPESINGHPIRLFDTLSMSRTLWPDRLLPKGCPSKVKNPLGGPAKTIGPHSLEAWGYKLANQKVVIEDWRGLMVWKYVDRVWEDVIINELQWEALVKEMTTNLGHGVSWTNALKRGAVSDYLMAKQEEQGVQFDVKGAEKLLVKTDTWMENLEQEVEPKLPLKDVAKSDIPTFPKDPFSGDGSISHYGWAYARKVLGYTLNEGHFSLVSPPKKAFKKDGGLSKAGENYCIKQGIQNKEEMPDFIRSQRNKVSTSKPLSDEDEKKLRQQLRDKYMPEKWLKAPMKISNQGDIKEWLVREGGWRPTIFNTKDVTRNEFKQNRKEEDVAQRVWEWIEDKRNSLYEPYLSMEVGFRIKNITSRSHKDFKKAVRKGRFLPTTPKFKDERGKLCPTLKAIDEGMAGQIVKWLSLRNRRSVIKSKDENKTTGWLNHPRLKVDGKLPARYSGLTNTFRRKHSVIANVPGSEALLGHEMRSLFTVPEGYWQLGIDGSNLEGMCAAWAAYPYDGGAYLEIMESGDAHASNAEAYSKAAGTLVTRQGGKSVTYG